MYSACKNLVSTRGLSSLYEGITPYLIADGISGAIKFTTFEKVQQYAENKVPTSLVGLSRFISAAVGYLASSFTYVPGDVLKTKLQAGNVSFVIISLGFTNVIYK